MQSCFAIDIINYVELLQKGPAHPCGGPCKTLTLIITFSEDKDKNKNCQNMAAFELLLSENDFSTKRLGFFVDDSIPELRIFEIRGRNPVFEFFQESHTEIIST